MTLLSINAGSSSLKVAVFDDNQLEVPQFSLNVEGIGTETATLVPNGEFGDPDTQTLPILTTAEAAEAVRQWLEEKHSIGPNSIKAIGHRIVHGGAKYTKATIVDEELMSYLESITPLAPNHMPATLASLNAFVQAFSEVPHVASFDTSFFADVPKVAKTLPIPKKVQDEYGIQRFGFHGLSYEYLLDSFTANEGQEAANGRVIMAHLGSGASVAASLNGSPIDMSMGFTPVSGIMMSTRTGDIEPGVLAYLQTQHGMTAEEVARMVTHESGLLGVSGVTNDMLQLLNTQHENESVALALELFTYKLKKQFGAYVAALGGVDSIIFTGGIGERSAEIRERVCSNLEFFGISIDEARNKANDRRISSDDSKVGVYVIPAREDASIMKEANALLNQQA